MLFLRRFLPFVVSLLAIIVLSSCGSTTTTGGGTTAAPTTAPTPTTAPVAALIKTAPATVQGKSVTLLTDAKGLTLYYFTPDVGQKIACTGTCATNWPPLVFTGTGTVPADPAVTGTLSVLQGANGNQVIYNGHPLYTFAADTAAGQTNGEGKGGKWFVATVDLAQNT